MGTQWMQHRPDKHNRENNLIGVSINSMGDKHTFTLHTKQLEAARGTTSTHVWHLTILDIVHSATQLSYANNAPI